MKSGRVMTRIECIQKGLDGLGKLKFTPCSSADWAILGFELMDLPPGAYAVVEGIPFGPVACFAAAVFCSKGDGVCPSDPEMVECLVGAMDALGQKKCVMPDGRTWSKKDLTRDTPIARPTGTDWDAEADMGVEARATAIKELGNDLFKRGLFLEAVSQYSNALNYVHGNTYANRPFSEIKVALLLNRAASQLQLQGWEEARSDCEDALVLHPGNIKGLFRLTEALVSLGRFKEADVHLRKLEAKKEGPSVEHFRVAIDQHFVKPLVGVEVD